jgi:hypothetical protein
MASCDRYAEGQGNRKEQTDEEENQSFQRYDAGIQSRKKGDSGLQPWSDGQGTKTLTAMAFIHTTTSTTSFL